MISTYDGLLTVAQKAQIQTKKETANIKKIKRNKKKENANEKKGMQIKKKMQIEKENANKTKT